MTYRLKARPTAPRNGDDSAGYLVTHTSGTATISAVQIYVVQRDVRDVVTYATLTRPRRPTSRTPGRWPAPVPPGLRS